MVFASPVILCVTPLIKLGKLGTLRFGPGFFSPAQGRCPGVLALRE
jgi:hypothetical protein